MALPLRGRNVRVRSKEREIPYCHTHDRSSLLHVPRCVDIKNTLYVSHGIHPDLGLAASTSPTIDMCANDLFATILVAERLLNSVLAKGWFR